MVLPAGPPPTTSTSQVSGTGSARGAGRRSWRGRALGWRATCSVAPCRVATGPRLSGPGRGGNLPPKGSCPDKGARERFHPQPHVRSRRTGGRLAAHAAAPLVAPAGAQGGGHLRVHGLVLPGLLPRAAQPGEPGHADAADAAGRLDPAPARGLLVYVSLWLYVGIAPSLQPSLRALLQYGAWATALCATGLACFYLWPTAVPSQAHHLDPTVAQHAGFALDARPGRCRQRLSILARGHRDVHRLVAAPHVVGGARAGLAPSAERGLVPPGNRLVDRGRAPARGAGRGRRAVLVWSLPCCPCASGQPRERPAQGSRYHWTDIDTDRS